MGAMSIAMHLSTISAFSVRYYTHPYCNILPNGGGFQVISRTNDPKRQMTYLMRKSLLGGRLSMDIENA